MSVHLAVLKLALLWRSRFRRRRRIATFVAMTSNFFLNNELTYRDRRLKGWSMLWGFLGFCAICSIGALTNVGLGCLALSPPSAKCGGSRALAGALMGAFWNYAMSSLFVWRTR